MMLKIYKHALLVTALLVTAGAGFAQDTTATPGSSTYESKSSDKDLRVLNMNLHINMADVKMAMDDVNVSIPEGMGELNRNLRDIAPEIKDITKNIRINGNDDKLDGMVKDGDIGEKVKNYSKTYPMDANDKLSIDNRFGKVVVNTWNKAEVKVDIEIKSYADDDNTAQKMIDAISISDSKSGDNVSFHTNFGNGNNNSIWDLFNNRNDHHKAEVNYTIYMPSKNALDIKNRYGATEVPDFDGKVSLDCAYGSLAAKSLMHPDNQIDVKYGSANIDAISSGDVKVGYGSLELGSADKLNAEVHYSSAHIGKIKSSANIDAHYAGNIAVDNLDKNFSNFSYSGNYSGLKIGLDNNTNANFDITVRYGSFDYGGQPIEITEKTPSDDSKGWKPTKNYKGHIGKGNSDKVINVSASYGGVKFE